MTPNKNYHRLHVLLAVLGIAIIIGSVFFYKKNADIAKDVHIMTEDERMQAISQVLSGDITKSPPDDEQAKKVSDFLVKDSEEQNRPSDEVLKKIAGSISNQ